MRSPQRVVHILGVKAQHFYFVLINFQSTKLRRTYFWQKRVRTPDCGATTGSESGTTKALGQTQNQDTKLHDTRISRMNISNAVRMIYHSSNILPENRAIA